MSDELNSQLSAFVDDELAPEESELLIRRLCRDDVLRETAASYALIGDVVRDELAITAPPDFAQRVMMAVAGQAAPPPDVAVATADHSIRNWGFAVAASVMLAAIALMTLPERTPELSNNVVADVADEVIDATANTSAESASAPMIAAIDNEARARTATLGIMPRTDDSRAVRFDVPMSIPVNRHSAENQARLNNLLLRHLNETGASRQGLVTYRNVGFVTQTGNNR